MKSKFAIALGVAATIGLSACISLDENIVSGVTASYYNTPDGVVAGLNAGYSGLFDLYGSERTMTMLEYGVDIWAVGADGSRKYFNFYDSQLQGRAGYVEDLWNAAYRDINTVNTTIARADSLETSALFTVDEQTQIVAQAKFLRALYYFHLVRQYGAIPIELEETKSASTEAHREPVADVYSKAIIPDLQAAIAALPLTADAGRATKGAAEHVLALVYLTRQDPGDAALAETLARTVVESGIYHLEPTYHDVWTLEEEAGPEVVFSLQTTNDPLTWAGGNHWHLYWNMVYDIEPGMHRTIDYGRPFRRLRPSAFFLDSLFDNSIDDRYNTSFNTLWLANNASTAPAGMEVGDTAIFLPEVKTSELDQAKYCGKPYEVITEPDDFWNAKQHPLGTGICSNVIAEYNRSQFPVLNKYLDPTRISLNEEHSQRDFLLYRFADTYLLLAEALVRQGKPGAAVYVNKVRERAAVPGHAADMDVTDADVDLAFILDERARELFGEGNRWFDLVRFHKLVELVGGRNHEATPNIQPYHALRPIPQSQIDLTHNEDGTTFEQNPGYQ